MKFLYLITFLAFLFIEISAHDPQRQVLITYPHDTASTYMAEAKTHIEAAVCLAIPVFFCRPCPIMDEIRLWLI